MKRIMITAWTIVLFTLSPRAGAQNVFDEFGNLFTQQKGYVIYRTANAIHIDGKPDEASWAKAPWTEYFGDIEGDRKPKPRLSTRCKMLWDEQNFYLYFYLEEPHVWAYYDTHDMVVFHENDIEVFIDPDRDAHTYYEFELNAVNTLFDLTLEHPYRAGGNPADHDWNGSGFESAVFVDGTVNDPSDRDKGWGVEMKIPFSSLTVDGSYMQPKDGSHWKINFSRVEWHADAENGKYHKRKDPETGKFLPEDNWVWSPQGVINMHLPERWGIGQFSSETAGGKNIDFEYPLDEELARHLWLVYYKQNRILHHQGKYATSLHELEIPAAGAERNIPFTIGLKKENSGWIAQLKAENGCLLMIDQSGLLKRTN